MESRITPRSRRQASQEFSKRLAVLTGAGGVAFWIVDFAIAVSPIAAEYRTAFSISSLPKALAAALVGGLVIALCVSLVLLRFFHRVPTTNPILKALILSFLAMVMTEGLSALTDPDNAAVYLLIDMRMNVPRFLALGTMVGCLYGKPGGNTRT
jgi:uncharacterized protein YacL